MKILFAIVSCRPHAAYRQAVRDTWLPEVGDKADAFFFVGRDVDAPETDVVHLECDDDYEHLPAKVQSIARWALEHNYDFMVKIDNDTVLLVDEFLKGGFDLHDFTGWLNTWNRVCPSPWGFCYTLSRKAMEVVIGSTLPDHHNDESWVSQNLLGHGIHLHSDIRYCLHGGAKEDFSVSCKRPIRKSKKSETQSRFPDVPGAFAYAMYIEWLGYRNCPAELNIKEMKRVYARERGLAEV
jgi:hypothetical protein